MNETDIFVLLNIPFDSSIIIDKVEEDKDNSSISITISKKLSVHFCPCCSNRMHSKGRYTRKVNHPIHQDGHQVYLYVTQRSFVCPNCGERETESFNFLQRYKHSSSLTPLLVVNAMKDLNRTAVSVAEQFNLSDSAVHDIFSQYVDIPRLPLPEYISIDEVYLDISDNDKYAFVIMDFQTGQIVDILHNRWQTTLDDYFIKIPYSERINVKGVISDAYDNYLTLCDKFFPNAVPVLDSFHVISKLTGQINIYINAVMRKYKQKQEEKLKEINENSNKEQLSIKDSREIILLRNYRWLLLKNHDDINYSAERHFHKLLNMTVSTYQLEDMFMELDPNFKMIRDTKEEIITFNSTVYDSEKDALEALDKIISSLSQNRLLMFRRYADFLKEHRYMIVRSFTTEAVSRKSKKDREEYYARLSNGPMESFNRKPKDYKRNTRGFSNFDYTRNRILWSTRIDPAIRAVPKSLEEIHSYKKKK